MADYKALIKDEKTQNWLKACIATDITKKGLSDFVNNTVGQLHKKILTDVRKNNHLPASATCNTCRTGNAVQCPSTNKCPISCNLHKSPSTMYKVCPNQMCNNFAIELRNYHRHHQPSFKNIDSTKWCSSAWELAKGFHPPDGYLDKTDASFTDFNGIVSVIINCKDFDTHVTENLANKNNIFVQSRNVVNSIRHTTALQIEDADLQNVFTSMKAILTDTKTLSGNTQAQEAMKTLSKLEADTLNITTDDVVKRMGEALDDTKTIISEANRVSEEAKRTNKETNDLQSKVELLKSKETELKKLIGKARDQAITDVERAGGNVTKDATDKIKIAGQIEENRVKEAWRVVKQEAFLASPSQAFEFVYVISLFCLMLCLVWPSCPLCPEGKSRYYFNCPNHGVKTTEHGHVCDVTQKPADVERKHELWHALDCNDNEDLCSWNFSRTLTIEDTYHDHKKTVKTLHEKTLFVHGKGCRACKSKVVDFLVSTTNSMSSNNLKTPPKKQTVESSPGSHSHVNGDIHTNKENNQVKLNKNSDDNSEHELQNVTDNEHNNECENEPDANQKDSTKYEFDSELRIKQNGTQNNESENKTNIKGAMNSSQMPDTNTKHAQINEPESEIVRKKKLDLNTTAFNNEDMESKGTKEKSDELKVNATLTESVPINVVSCIRNSEDSTGNDSKHKKEKAHNHKKRASKPKDTDTTKLKKLTEQKNTGYKQNIESSKMGEQSSSDPGSTEWKQIADPSYKVENKELQSSLKQMRTKHNEQLEKINKLEKELSKCKGQSQVTERIERIEITSPTEEVIPIEDESVSQNKNSQRANQSTQRVTNRRDTSEPRSDNVIDKSTQNVSRCAAEILNNHTVEEINSQKEEFLKSVYKSIEVIEGKLFDKEKENDKLKQDVQTMGEKLKEQKETNETLIKKMMEHYKICRSENNAEQYTGKLRFYKTRIINSF